jgi:hypothetical protein
MPTSLKRFKVEQGFESPGFIVDESGNTVVNAFSAASIATSALNADNVFIDGNLLFLNGGQTLGNSVVNSSLKTIGTLDNLTVNGSTTLKYNSNAIVQIIDDKIYITSVQTGTIDNVNIGSGTPGTVKATQVNVVAQGTTPGQLNAANADINLNNTTISGATLFTSPPRSTTAPSLGEHLARKDYVDNSVVALSIALGI